MSHPFSVLERKEWATELWKMDGSKSSIDKALVQMCREVRVVISWYPREIHTFVCPFILRCKVLIAQCALNNFSVINDLVESKIRFSITQETTVSFKSMKYRLQSHMNTSDQ